MTKLWISPSLELRHAINGWPEWPSKPGPMSHQEAFTEYYEDDIPAYNKALAQAKADSIPVEGTPVGFLPDRLPNTFIQWDGEVEVVELCDRGSCVYGAAGCFAEGMTGERCQARKVARFTPTEKKETESLPGPDQRQRLWTYMLEQHGVTLLESEMDEIQNILTAADNPQYAPTIAQQAIAQVRTGKQLPFPCKDITECLDSMLICDLSLYEKILDTAGFAYYFSQIIRIAKDKEQQLAAAQERVLELEEWKSQQMEMTMPILNYCDDNSERLGINLGMSMFKRVLEILKEHNAVNRQTKTEG